MYTSCVHVRGWKVSGYELLNIKFSIITVHLYVDPSSPTVCQGKWAYITECSNLGYACRTSSSIKLPRDYTVRYMYLHLPSILGVLCVMLYLCVAVVY